MKILFLDIDGVLNSSRTALVTKTQGLSYLECMKAGIDKTAVALVNRLCHDNNLKIVLSSNHRYDYMYPDTVTLPGGFSRDKVDLFRLGLYLEQLGLDHTLVLDATPDINVPGKRRGDEVQRWLNLNDYPKYNVSHFIILDDVDQFSYETDFRERFVQVDGNEGFSFKNFRDCEKLLGVNNDKVRIILPPK